MRKKIFFTGGLLLVLILIWGLRLYYKPHAGTANENPDFSLTAAAFYREFQSNESSANKKFVGKVVEVQGAVLSVENGSRNGSILLDASAPGGVNCSFSAESLTDLKKLKKGDPVRIKGRCTGFLMDVNLVDCVLNP